MVSLEVFSFSVNRHPSLARSSHHQVKRLSSPEICVGVWRGRLQFDRHAYPIVSVGEPNGYPGKRAVAWGGGDRTREGSARRGGPEGLRLDDCAPAHGRTGGGRGGGCLSRVVGQQLHDRQRGRRRRRPSATLTRFAPRRSIRYSEPVGRAKPNEKI